MGAKDEMEGRQRSDGGIRQIYTKEGGWAMTGSCRSKFSRSCNAANPEREVDFSRFRQIASEIGAEMCYY